MVTKFRPQRVNSPSNFIGAGHARRSDRQLAEANERQRVLFQELQHRVANTLHSMAATIEIAMGK